MDGDPAPETARWPSRRRGAAADPGPLRAQPVRAGTARPLGGTFASTRPDEFPIPGSRGRGASSIVMESRPAPPGPVPVEPSAALAEDLPELYRAILDRVAELERIGARRDAGRIRAAATRCYSDAWNESARRELLRLLARAHRGLAVPEHPRGFSLRRRPATAR